MANRLSKATSPYLLQHAHNPVDWFEWSTEALAKAKQEDKPILVSIGYSSCHWCHVMERESFENDEIASIMNEHFVCIKVDREERPDIDQIYMEAIQAMQQHGGWPLNVFLTPDQKPFYGGTYFPSKNWAQLLLQVSKAFQQKRKEIDVSAEELRQHLQTSDLRRFTSENVTAFSQEALDNMFRTLASRFDKTWGGIEKAPKFVMPSIWQFLLRYYAMTKDEQGLHLVTHTLRQIAYGGIYDQAGGGFSRYSVDAEWFAPHFEKMLYDNAQLLSLYSEAYTAKPLPLFKEVVYETVAWLQREMLHKDGGFYSALDADSEGVEGKFYTWTAAEIKELAGTDYEYISQYYEISEAGWEHGRNILRRSPDSDENLLPEKIKSFNKKLLEVREHRIRPGLDDKILTGWNAMMIHGLTDAYRAFGDPLFLQLAVRAISFIENNLIDDGKVFRAFKSRHSNTEGFLEDYAFLIQAYTSLYQVTFDESWVRKAEKWCDYVQTNFYDPAEKYYHFTANTAEGLIARKKEIFDNVIPASNSVMARNLLTLSTLLDKESWRKQAEQMVSALAKLIESEPGYMSYWGIALTQLTKGTAEVVISGPHAEAIRKELHTHLLPFIVTVGTTSSGTLPLLEGRDAKKETLIYVCFNKTCQLPVTTVAQALEQLTKNSFL